MPYADKSKQAEANRAWYERNKDSHKARAQAFRDTNPEIHRAMVRDWKSAHPEKLAAQRVRERMAKGCQPRLHSAHVRCWQDQPKPDLHDAHVVALKADDAFYYAWRYHNDPSFALKERMRRQLRKKAEACVGVAEIIRAALKRGGKSGRIESLLGYSIEQLRTHIERQFLPGMSWAGMSVRGWHVDHILPRKCFDLTSIEGIQAYWSLANLRPLWATDNIRKGAKVETLL